MKQVKQRLAILELTGEVIWSGRLNSLEVKTIYGGRVKGLPQGTPDWLVLVRGRSDNIVALFIECKSDTGKIRDTQQYFINKYGTKEGLFIMVMRDIKELDRWIGKHAKNFVDLLPKEL